jgi:outer membrane protein
MRKIIPAIIIAGSAVLSTSAHADFIGAGGAVASWFSGLNGNFIQGSDTADLEESLGLDRGFGIMADVHIEHPVPLIPNLRIAYVSVEETGSSDLNSGFYGFPANTNVASELFLEQIDVTAYYEILDNIVSVDVGLTVRALDSELEVSSGGISKVNRVKTILPMAYVAAKGKLPFTGVGVGAELNAISYGGDSALDAMVYGQYDMNVLSFKAGYRHMAIDFEDGNSSLDLTLGGPFMSIGADF